MSKTNQERVQDNNKELHNLKSQIDNLPEYQDLEPIYDITDITTYQIPYTPVSNYNNGMAYVRNYFSYDKKGAENSSAEHYLGRINQDGTVTLFKSRNGYGFIVIVDVIDNYIYYTSTTSSGSYIGNFTIYRINMDSTPYVEENYMTIGNLASATWSTDIQFISPSILGFGSANYIQIDLLNKTYVTRNTNNSPYKMSSLVGLDGNRKKVQNMSTGIISPSNYSDIIRFVNVSISKAIVGNHLYGINNDLSQGSLIKENVLSNLNVSLGDYIITNFDGNYYYLFPTRSFSPTTTGYLLNFNEDTNEFTIAYTLNKLTISADRQSFLTPYYVSSNGYVQYLTCNANINKLIGYEVYGNKLYLNRLENIQSSNILNNYQVYEKDGTAIIGSMPNNGALNYTPSTSQQTIPSGYTSGGTISAVDSTIDENIIADNIKKDVEILGVTGTLEEGIDTSDATAIANDILEGKTAYVNGVKLTGTMENLSNTITEQENLIANLYSLVNTKANGTGGGPFVVPDGMRFVSSKLTTFPNNMDMSKVMDMGEMFAECTNLINIPEFNTINATNMSAMFWNCTNLVEMADIDMSNVVNARNMFYNCTNLTNLPNISALKMLDASALFYNCTNLVDIPKINIINATNISHICQNCINLVNITDFTTGHAVDMSYAFCNCVNLANISSFSAYNTANMQDIFTNCNNLSADSYANIANSLPLAANLANQYVVNLGLNIINFTDEQVIILNNKGYIDAIPRTNRIGLTYNITYTI